MVYWTGGSEAAMALILALAVPCVARIAVSNPSRIVTDGDLIYVASRNRPQDDLHNSMTMLARDHAAPRRHVDRLAAIGALALPGTIQETRQRCHDPHCLIAGGTSLRTTSVGA
jgi:hypothetical protein